MKRRESILKRLSEIRGRVIHGSVDVESALTFRLVNYFYRKNCEQKSKLNWLVINPLDFDKKIKLFEELPYFQKRKYYAETKRALRSIQSLRNAVAHWEAITTKSGVNSIYLQSPKNLKNRIVTEQVMADFERDVKDVESTLFGFDVSPFL